MNTNKRIYKIVFWFLFSLSVIFMIRLNWGYKNGLRSANFFSGFFFKLQQRFILVSILKKENQILLEENVSLKNDLQKIKKPPSKKIQDFKYIAANIIRNSYKKPNNIIVIDKGLSDSIAVDMGVVNSKGIVGIVDKVSENYANVISILNMKVRINAGFYYNNYFGTLYWEYGNFKRMILSDLEIDIPIQKGDTIITAGMSYIFPKGIPIGFVSEIEKNTNEIKAEVTLFNDMRNLKAVQIIKNNHKAEILSLISE